MKRKEFFASVGLFAAFVLWTLLVCFVDVRKIGPQQTTVGFGALNQLAHSHIGVNMLLYEITDWLGLVPVAIALGFAILGLIQLIMRKSLLKVDFDILALGVFYIVVISVYLFFEAVVINYRPVLIDGYLEASYPSSTTTLVLCVMITAVMQINARVKNRVFKRTFCTLIILFIGFMVVGRLLSGVHWLSDIIGGALLSASLVTLYHSLARINA